MVHTIKFTHEQRVHNGKIDSKQLSHGILVLRDGEFEHLPVRTEEFVRVILNRIEVVVEAWSTSALNDR